jgi:hypothetical protein
MFVFDRKTVVKSLFSFGLRRLIYQKIGNVLRDQMNVLILFD